MSIATFTKIIYLKNVFKHISHCFGGRGHTLSPVYSIFTFLVKDSCWQISVRCWRPLVFKRKIVLQKSSTCYVQRTQKNKRYVLIKTSRLHPSSTRSHANISVTHFLPSLVWSSLPIDTLFLFS